MSARVVPSDVVGVIQRIYPWTSLSSAEYHTGPSSLDGNQLVTHRIILELVEAIPEELRPRERSDAVLFLVVIGSIRGSVELWANRPEIPVPSRLEFGGMRGGVNLGPRHAVAALADVLARCPDSAPLLTSAELTFIAGDAERESIRLDMSAASHSLATGEFKAAAVLAGSALEALLLWAVWQRETSAIEAAAAAWQAQPKPEKGLGIPEYDKNVIRATPDEWQLAALTEMAFHLGVIDEKVRNAARLARDARNMVHPGKVRRERLSISKGVALQSIAAMERVAERLTVLHPPVTEAPIAADVAPLVIPPSEPA